MNRIRKTFYTILLLILLLPETSFAAPANFKDLVVGTVLPILRLMVSVIIAFTVLIIIWNGAQLIMNADNAEKKSDSKSRMLWSIVVLAIMVSFWGIIAIFRGTVGV